MTKLTHIDNKSNAQMVDISHKKITKRCAVAKADMHVGYKTGKAISENSIIKGNVFAVAKIAGIQAAKRTSDLIPMCHPLPVTSIVIEIKLDDKLQNVHIKASVEVDGKTGVEMEALTAASVTALTVYDMCKAVDKGITITGVYLAHKSGGKSGDWNMAQ